MCASLICTENTAPPNTNSALGFSLEPLRHQINLNGFLAAGRRFHMLHIGKAFFDACQKFARSAALERLADENPAWLEHLFGHVERQLEQHGRSEERRVGKECRSRW